MDIPLTYSELLALLKEAQDLLEYAGYVIVEEYQPRCAVCGGIDNHHSSDCRLAAFLDKVEKL